MNKILITGGAGFIGARMARHLVDAGTHVICVDRVSSPEEFQDLPAIRFTYVQSDLCDPGSARRVARACPDGGLSVLHCCGTKEDAYSPCTEKFWRVSDANVLPGIHLIETLSERISYFCYASTMSVYGIPLSNPVGENHPEKPISAYGYSKLLCEKMLYSLAGHNKFPLGILRLSSIFDRGHLSKAIQMFQGDIQNEKEITLFGSRAVTRDYLHVSDLVSAVTRVLNDRLEGVLNLGSGRAVSLTDIVNVLAKKYGKNARVRFDRSRPDSFDFLLDISKARKSIGFQPTIDILEDLSS
ncbi:MAG: NAD(P)-dependent oxidoreductase [Pseudomonadota bacterium]